ncbi:MAG: YggS family pyridoxal phosphate-dependent enzyme [Bacillota bacterium]|nr:YggS family pyridoxal phosphate-dependent enzyme [Bacillota bacterium]
MSFLYMLAENYREVLKNIEEAALKAGRNPENIKLIAVTKTVGIDEVRQAANLGMKDFGENRVQDAAEKVISLPDLNWHFIGHLQSNKVKDVLPYYMMIHSLDRLSLAKAVQSWAEKLDLLVNMLIQVNVSGEESKFGMKADDLGSFINQIDDYDRIRVLGLMTMAPFVADPEEARCCFKKLRQLRDEYSKPGMELPELSMGMTNDYLVAVEEGATILRIGSALFS